MRDGQEKPQRVQLLAIVKNFHENGGGAPESIRLLAQKLSKFVVIDVLSKTGFHRDVGQNSYLPDRNCCSNTDQKSEGSKYSLLIACGPWISPVIWIKSFFILRSIWTPMIYLPRGGLSEYEFQKSKRNLIKYVYFFVIEIWFILLAKRIIYSSELEKNSTFFLRSGLFSRSYEIIPDLVDFDDTKRKNADQKSVTMRLGFIAELHPVKSLRETVDAFKLLDADNDQRFSLSIAGEPRQSGLHYSREILADLPKNVSYVGRVRPLEKEEFFSKLDALLVPSKFESFSLVCAEAIKYRVPIICSKNIGFIDGLSCDELNIYVLEEVSAMSIYKAIKNFNYYFDEKLLFSVSHRNTLAVEKYTKTIKQLTDVSSNKTK